MHNLILLLLNFLRLTTSHRIIKLDDYCKFDRVNTPCLYRCTLAERCNQLSEPFVALTRGEREYVLRRHNELRDDVAAGKHAVSFLPKASDMHVISYDIECEFFAACYIFQCIWAHDKSRRDLNGKHFGQNLYTLRTQVPKVMNDDWIEGALMGWFKETRFMNQNYSDMFFNSWGNPTEPGVITGHLTQMIWAKVRYLGCAKLASRRNKPNYTYDFYCDYRPSGNVYGRSMYKRGEPVTECPAKEKPNDLYPNLCGEIRPMREDSYVPPIPEMVGYHIKQSQHSHGHGDDDGHSHSSSKQETSQCVVDILILTILNLCVRFMIA